ncbi:hypothetical protein [Phaeobacter sp. C3_T13_0]
MFAASELAYDINADAVQMAETILGLGVRLVNASCLALLLGRGDTWLG